MQSVSSNSLRCSRKLLEVIRQNKHQEPQTIEPGGRIYITTVPNAHRAFLPRTHTESSVRRLPKRTLGHRERSLLISELGNRDRKWLSCTLSHRDRSLLNWELGQRERSLLNYILGHWERRLLNRTLGHADRSLLGQGCNDGENSFTVAALKTRCKSSPTRPGRQSVALDRRTQKRPGTRARARKRSVWGAAVY